MKRKAPTVSGAFVGGRPEGALPSAMLKSVVGIGVTEDASTQPPLGAGMGLGIGVCAGAGCDAGCDDGCVGTVEPEVLAGAPDVVVVATELAVFSAGEKPPPPQPVTNNKVSRDNSVRISPPAICTR